MIRLKLHANKIKSSSNRDQKIVLFACILNYSTNNFSATSICIKSPEENISKIEYTLTSPKLARSIVIEDHKSMGPQENPLWFEVEVFGCIKHL